MSALFSCVGRAGVKPGPSAFWALLWCLFAPLLNAARLPEKIDFNHHIKPLLSDRCFACHGPDEKARKAKLRLDLEGGVFKAIEEGRFIVKPGDLDKSELVRRISSTDPEEIMPPPKSNLALSRDEIELLRRWIAQGAEWKKHWAFIPVQAIVPPDPRERQWCRNEIDRFVLARLEREGLRPAAPAGKERLLRRVTLDLTGLAPTLGEMDDFLADSAPDAYERAVERLLVSPAYGERMAVEWLDVARYADTHGYQSDRFNHLWPWRDWVISAFNRNLPLDDFIVWQIAGDLLPDATREQRLATAFNRLHRQTNEGGSVEEEFRVEYNADRVHTMAGAFLGLTMECARCHDHKYDPISQKDYYRLFAFFNSTDEAGLYSHFTDAIPSPTLLLFRDDAQEAQHGQMRQTIAAKEEALASRRQTAQPDFEAWLRNAEHLPGPAGLVARYTFDQVISNRVANALSTNFTAKLNDGPKAVPGRFGQALQFNGENSVTIDKVADFKRPDPFSLCFWLKIPEERDEIVVLHHQQAGSDAGYHGYQFVLESGYASFALIHFWPGNAVKVRTNQKLKLDQWLHIGVRYDGSSRARGLNLFVDGQLVEIDVLRDSLFKDYANGVALTLGARFRGRGFKDGLIDDLRIFDRCLTELEMRAVASNKGEGSHETGAYPGPSRAAGTAARPTLTQAATNLLFEHYLATANKPSAKLRGELKQLRQAENDFINGIPEIMVMGDREPPRPTYVLKRGLYDAPDEAVEPGTPESILPLERKLPRNRLGLAQWLIDPKNPLTARVLVNRYWQLFFGRGLVETAENFGSQGTLPVHPELLDWLAQRLMASGWDLKALCKLILTSATYRQSSEAGAALLAGDPDNELLARGPRQRLTAEMLRDQALEAAGLLVARIGGPSVKPYQPEGIWEEKSSGWKYEPDKGEGLYRRSLYTYWKRTVPHPAMLVFDAAERNNCTVRRQSTSTPLQPLVLLNDPQFVEVARKIAERAWKEANGSADDRIVYVFRLLTGRPPADREREVLRRLYREQLDLARAASSETPLAKASEATQHGSFAGIEKAAVAQLASAILNFDETVMKR